jgi:hypothetical protein
MSMKKKTKNNYFACAVFTRRAHYEAQNQPTARSRFIYEATNHPRSRFCYEAIGKGLESISMSDENDRRKKSWESIKNTALVISLFLSIFSVLYSVSEFPIRVATFWGEIARAFSALRVQTLINAGNILVSFCFLLAFLSKKLLVEYRINWGKKEQDFCELAEIGKYEDKEENIPRKILVGYESRVTRLFSQYRWIMRLFAISLVFVYLTILFTPSPDPVDRYLSKFVLATNIFNFLEGIIVLLAFRVLYSITLGKKGKDFWVIPSGLAAIYILVFIYWSWRLDWTVPHTVFLNIFDLVAGSVNGLAMVLLFGRYVSLEQSLRETDLFRAAFRNLFKPLPLFETEKSYKGAVSFGIIFLLPFYALAQPLFGSLTINLYGSPIGFQNTVYAICLVGKICFFHLTYLLMRKKLLHLYLYGLVSQVGNFHKLEECLTTTPETPTHESPQPL